MKKLFLGRSKISLMVRTVALLILGLAAAIGLTGTLPLFAQPIVPLSHHFCNSVAGSVAVCHRLVNSSGIDDNRLSKNPTLVKRLPVHHKNTNSGSNSSSSASSPPPPSPTPAPLENNTPSEQEQTQTPSGNNTPSEQGQTQTPPGNNTPSGQGQTGSTDTATQAAQAVFDQINTARAQAGLPALQMSTQLVNSAHKHNLAMQSANQLSHQLPNEPGLGTRISQEGVQWSFVGENIGYSSDYLHPTKAATGLNQSMLNEQPPNDGHRRNILSKDFTIVGIDVLIDTTNHRVWLTEDFAKV